MLSTAWSAEEAQVQTLGDWQAICWSTGVIPSSWSRPTEGVKEGRLLAHEINPAGGGDIRVEQFDTGGQQRVFGTILCSIIRITVRKRLRGMG